MSGRIPRRPADAAAGVKVACKAPRSTTTETARRRIGPLLHIRFVLALRALIITGARRQERRPSTWSTGMAGIMLNFEVM
jgi:hypothetical protein